MAEKKEVQCDGVCLFDLAEKIPHFFIHKRPLLRAFFLEKELMRLK